MFYCAIFFIDKYNRIETIKRYDFIIIYSWCSIATIHYMRLPKYFSVFRIIFCQNVFLVRLRVRGNINCARLLSVKKWQPD